MLFYEGSIINVYIALQQGMKPLPAEAEKDYLFEREDAVINKADIIIIIKKGRGLMPWLFH